MTRKRVRLRGEGAQHQNDDYFL